jgi:hypothetical protein
MLITLKPTLWQGPAVRLWKVKFCHLNWTVCIVNFQNYWGVGLKIRTMDKVRHSSNSVLYTIVSKLCSCNVISISHGTSDERSLISFFSWSILHFLPVSQYLLEVFCSVGLSPLDFTSNALLFLILSRLIVSFYNFGRKTQNHRL